MEKERQARLKEREKSLREEHIDGGYLVTLGTYTGPEDFNKNIVRQLQVRTGQSEPYGIYTDIIQDRATTSTFLERLK